MVIYYRTPLYLQYCIIAELYLQHEDLNTVEKFFFQVNDFTLQCPSILIWYALSR
jgi:hypothetical protein